MKSLWEAIMRSWEDIVLIKSINNDSKNMISFYCQNVYVQKKYLAIIHIKMSFQYLILQ